MTKKSRFLGILLPDIHGEFYSELLRGADAEARRQGFHLLIGSEGRDEPAPLFSPSIVGFIAGVAVMITEPNEALLKAASESGLPLVVIDEDMNGNRIDRVLVDNAAGTREAVEHLLSSVGPGDCYFLGGPEENFDTVERARVFLETLAAHGHAARSDQVRYGEYNVEWGQRAAEQLFAKRPARPMGILCGNDEIAFGMIYTAREKGVHIPSDARVVGFDDSRLAALVRPQLSSVRVPIADLGAAAIKTLIERVQAPERETMTLTIPTRLVVRGSSRTE